MDDLISIQAAIDAVSKACEEWRGIFARCEEKLLALPSAQPEILACGEGELNVQPEIVRCKDCKHYQYADNRAFGFPVRQCEWTGFEDVDEDDFCSRAERREE